MEAADAANFSAKLVRTAPLRATTLGDAYCPTLFELYGQGNIAAHGCRRDLNLNGLRAFDLRTRNQMATGGISERHRIGGKRADMLKMKSRPG